MTGNLPPTPRTMFTTVLDVTWIPRLSAFEIQCPEGVLRLTLYRHNVVRLVLNGPSSSPLLQGVLHDSALEAIQPELSEMSEEWQIRDGQVSIHIHRNPFSINIFYGSYLAWATLPQGIATYYESVWCETALCDGAHVYGLGEKVGGINKRPGRWMQWSTDTFLHTPNADPLYLAVPFALIQQGTTPVGLFLANSYRTYFDADVSQPNVLTMGADGGDLDLFVFLGPVAEIIAHYTALTGRISLPPQYALGFQQSRYSYETANDVIAIATKFRDYQVPCDVLYLDIDYMNGYRVFTWDSQRFPNARALLQHLHDAGFRVVVIVDPGVKLDPDYPVYQEGHINNYFVTYRNGEEFHSRVWPGLCAFPDFVRPETRQWWAMWNASLIEQGIDGIWNDMNEPAWNDSETDFYGHDNDADVVHRDGQDGVYGHSALHNLYALLEAQATFQGILDAGASKTDEGVVIHRRPFVISRSGFSGIQRYAAVWTGDNCSWWEHLAMAIPMCLNMGLSGIPFVGPDIGGFQYNATPELYARWIQMGVFFPFVRAHSAKDTAPHEPWAFGERVLAIARQYITYRYRLLPYWYTLFHEATQSGAPLMRPLFWDNPAEPVTWDIDDQFLVGPYLMVAPVLHPGVTERSVFIPSGTWYHFWTHKPIAGPMFCLVASPLEEMPIFVKAGSIIPLGPDVPSTAFLDCQDVVQGTDGPREFLIIRGTGQFDVYSDDGMTDAYHHGAYRIIRVHVDEQEGLTTITWAALHWPTDQQYMQGEYTIHIGYYDTPPHSVCVHGTPLSFTPHPPKAGQWTWHQNGYVTIRVESLPRPDKNLEITVR